MEKTTLVKLKEFSEYLGWYVSISKRLDKNSEYYDGWKVMLTIYSDIQSEFNKQFSSELEEARWY